MAIADALDLGVGTSGQVVQTNGNTITLSTATYPLTTTINQILFSSANNTVTGLATANNNVLTTNGSGVPTLLATLPLSIGGTNASLTANNGGIFYSTSSAAAILNGTATANQVLLSGLSTAPSWSTATYPATTTINQILFSSAANTISGLTTANNGVVVTNNTGVPSVLAGSGTTNTILQANAAGAPTWSTATYPTTTTTNNILYSQGANNVIGLATATMGVLVTSNSGAPSILAGSGATGNILQSKSNGAPTWSTPTYPTGSGSAGQILRSDGTNNIYSTSTFADTYTASNLLFSNGANTVQGLATANNGVLVTSGAGVPSISSTLPSGMNATNLNLTTPILDTPSSGTLTNCTGYTTANLSDTAWTSWTPGFTGFSANPTAVVAFQKKIGKTCMISINMTAGTSNATTFTITGLPFTSGSNLQFVNVAEATNNSAFTSNASGSIAASGTTLTLNVSALASGWTALGTKGVNTMFMYETA